MAYQRRAEELNKHKTFARKDRIVLNKGQFFYRSRENGLVGPFDSIADARFALNQFVESHLEEKAHCVE